MTKYAAFLRGIGPQDPKMRNENLRAAAENRGYKNVQTVISSGNVVFETNKAGREELEAQLEEAWRDELGFKSTTIVFAKDELEKLAAQKLFGDVVDEPRTRLHVTFLQTLPPSLPKLPHVSERGDYTIVGIYGRALCTTIDSTSEKSSDFMIWVEKYFGKNITTRSWRTVLRVLAKMST